MAEFTLPKNSKISRKGRTWKPEEGKRLKRFRIYRYDPDTSANAPKIQRGTTLVFSPSPLTGRGLGEG